MPRFFLFAFLASFVTTSIASSELKVRVHALDTDKATQGIGKDLGEIWLKQTDHGLVFIIDIKGLQPGRHGFHVHELGSCALGMKEGKVVPGLSAGDHYDPKHTHKHLGPYNTDGHMGDLPPLACDAQGICRTEVVAPHLHLKDIKGRSLIIHEKGDNFSDTPLPLGGGGPRVACALIK